ncbi:MAG: SWIM zinc finger family protein [Thermoplasmata archaeon]
MKAIIDGLKEAKQKGSRYLLIKTDNRWCAHILVGLWRARKPHTIPVANEAIELVQGFEGVAVILTPTKSIREVDIAAGDAARAKRVEAEAVKKKRIEDLKAAMERASNVRLEETEEGWLANGRFVVTVDPPSCTCQWWSLRWKDVPLAGKRAHRLPCKHIIAAARKEGIAEPEDLIALSQRAEE